MPNNLSKKESIYSYNRDIYSGFDPVHAEFVVSI